MLNSIFKGVMFSENFKGSTLIPRTRKEDG